MRDPRLALRQGVRAGVVGPEQRPPAPGEVAVQVDAVGILARVSSDSVRIQVGDDPEIEIAGRAPLEQPRDRTPARLVAVDATDDQDAPPRPVPDLNRGDRPALPGAAGR